MPLTAAFELVVIGIYIFGANFAPALAPYGESDVFDKINLLPGDDPMHILGIDQIGRDLLTRLIYGGRNTVGIAFVATVRAFPLGVTFGFRAAVLGG